MNKPYFKDQEVFEGKILHSQEWNESTDVRDKRVGVIGTGASAVQIIPNIAPIAQFFKKTGEAYPFRNC